MSARLHPDAARELAKLGVRPRRERVSWPVAAAHIILGSCLAWLALYAVGRGLLGL